MITFHRRREIIQEMVATVPFEFERATYLLMHVDCKEIFRLRVYSVCARNSSNGTAIIIIPQSKKQFLARIQSRTQHLNNSISMLQVLVAEAKGILLPLFATGCIYFYISMHDVRNKKSTS